MASVYATYPFTASSGGVPIYATFAAFPAGTAAGQLGVAANTGILYEWTGAAWQIIGGPGLALSVGTFDSGTASVNGAHIDTNALIMQSASLTRPGLVNLSNQTFGGLKSFTRTLAIGGTADEVQFAIQANAAQSSNVIEIITSGFSYLLRLNNSGDLTIPGIASIGGRATANFFTGQSGSPAASGVFRFSNTEGMAWRNNLNNADLSLTVNASDQLSYAGTVLFGQIIDSGATASTVPYFDASKQLTSSAVTPTQLSYVDATSSIQTQLNAKLTTVLNSALILVGNASNAATAVAMSGDISITNTGVTAYTGTVPVNKGGTNLTAGTSGGVLGYTGTGTLASSALLAASAVMLGGGAGATPTTLANGAALALLQMNSGGTAPAWVTAIAAVLSQGAVHTATFTTPANSSTSTQYFYIVTGGGGGGGGTNGASSSAGGGGAGGTGIGVFSGVAASTSVTITTGGGGAGGLNTGATGTTGTSSSIAATGLSTITSTGGVGGAGTTGNPSAGGAGGTCSNSTVSVTGGTGFQGTTIAAPFVAGPGGGSLWGTGGPAASSYTSQTGSAGAAYGSGGGGAFGATAVGGAGAAGIVIVIQLTP